MENNIEKLYSLGGFRVVRFTDGDHSYIRIQDPVRSWELTYRDDNQLYGIWTLMTQDPSYHRGIDVLVTMAYIITTTTVDAAFISDFFKAHDALMTRQLTAAEQPTEEEQAQAIREVQALMEMQEAAKKEESTENKEE